MSLALEKSLERRVRQHCHRNGVLCLKFVSPNYRGVPDRLLVGLNGVVGFLELKREGERTSALQRHFLRRLQQRQIPALWTDNFSDFERWFHATFLSP